MTEGIRAQVARLINPVAFERGSGVEYVWPAYQSREDALTKASAIIALLAAARPAQVTADPDAPMYADEDAADRALFRALWARMTYGDGSDPGAWTDVDEGVALLTGPDKWPIYRAMTRQAAEAFTPARSANARALTAAAAWELLYAAKYLSEISLTPYGFRAWPTRETAALKRGFDALDTAIAKAEGREA